MGTRSSTARSSRSSRARSRRRVVRTRRRHGASSTFSSACWPNHRPEYLGWVHDSGLSFRHERYPAYKATREKLTEELQADFDTGMERICQLLDAYRIPILSLQGYEADDVIGTLARAGRRSRVRTS